MSKELIKSIVLTILVFISCFMTWNIWTYLPNMNEIKQPDILSDVTISNKQQIEAIVQPIKIFFHNGNKHYGSNLDIEIASVMEEVSAWNFSDYKDVSNTVLDDFQGFLNKSSTTELIFPDLVPLSAYKKVISISDKDISDVNFDRILIRSSSDDQHIYFVDTENRKIHRFYVDVDSVKQFSEDMIERTKNYQLYSVAQLNQNKNIYLPIQSTKINSYKYYVETIDVKKFRDALFSDPNFVTQKETSRGERYSDVLSSMNVYEDTMTLRFIDPTQKKTSNYTPTELLEKSIEFINDHSGWDDNFRFDSIVQENQKAIYRLYMNSLPVFNDSGMSEIEQVWAIDDIYSYKRPYFTLHFPMPSGTSEITLSSGEEALEKLTNIDGINVDSVEDLTVGYGLTRDSKEGRLVSLEPGWFYKYDGQWKSLNSMIVEVFPDGME